MLDIKALKTTIRASDSRDDRAFESNTFICDIKNSGSSGVIPDLLFSSEVYPIDCSLVTTKSLKSKTWLCFLCSCWWWGRTKCSWWWFRPKNWVKWYEARLRSKCHILTFPDHPADLVKFLWFKSQKKKRLKRLFLKKGQGIYFWNQFLNIHHILTFPDHPCRPGKIFMVQRKTRTDKNGFFSKRA